jgi:hypothetical protein
LLKDKLLGHFEMFKQNYGIYIVAFCITMIVAKGFEYINQLYYLIVPILLCVILLKLISKGRLKNWKVTIYFMPFVLWILLSWIWSVHPEITFKRSIYFLFLIIGMESLSDLYQKDRGAIVKVFLPVIVGVITISFYSIEMKIPADYWSGGNGLGLKGFAAHQNTLSSILLICLAIMNLRLLERFTLRKDPGGLLVIIIFGNILTLVILLLTFSRGAILSYLVFLFTFLILSIGFKKTIGISFIGTIIFFIFILIPPIEKYIDYSMRKGAPSVISSRSELYKISFNAALDGGIIGIGYGMSNPKYVDKYLTHQIDGINVREKGNSILALTEEVGIIGLCLFYIPVFIVLYSLARSLIPRKSSVPLYEKKISSKKDKMERVFLFSILVSMLVHSQVEAWSTGVGSVLLPVFLFFLAISEKSRVKGEKS